MSLIDDMSNNCTIPQGIDEPRQSCHHCDHTIEYGYVWHSAARLTLKEPPVTIAWKYVAAAALLALGILHILFGLTRFHAVLTAAWHEGLAGRFGTDDERRLAFWFIAFGAPLTLCGHLAVRAAAAADLKTLGLIGLYGCATGAVGIIAFPRSPLWGLLAVSILLVAVGQEWLV
ncbi:hypothetical protein IV454_24430 [Massilia antarctica]|uniref:Uncharacterized protein n=1 Tax=Massilia antarctica TaxID=2765360 RepID=A0AA48W9V2_9BURK|nr:DUF6463 family protein [Massilia antarctica]QPI48645.1 hypothetical protein IV454_24430 [Massilia antarctica]